MRSCRIEPKALRDGGALAERVNAPEWERQLDQLDDYLKGELIMEVTHSTFTLERHYPAAVERVFEAWANPQARKRWMAKGAEHSQDFMVGGLETVKGFDGQRQPVDLPRRQYVEIVINERILTTSTLRTGDRLSTVSVTSVEFRG